MSLRVHKKRNTAQLRGVVGTFFGMVVLVEDVGGKVGNVSSRIGLTGNVERVAQHRREDSEELLQKIVELHVHLGLIVCVKSSFAVRESWRMESKVRVVHKKGIGNKSRSVGEPVPTG